MQSVFSIQELFTGKVFQIPDYQRGYAWEQDQLADFWDDLEYLGNGKDHYTGTIILHGQNGRKLDEQGTSHDVFHVVDGQQRLTTIVLLLNCLRSVFQDTNPTLAEGIKKSYLQFIDYNRQPVYKLQLNSDCQDFWANSIVKDDPVGPQGPGIASHQRLRDAKTYFTNQVSEKKMKSLGNAAGVWPMEMFQKLTQQLKMNQYVVADSAEVGVIFEVMNDRGKPLSDLEKVKNYLLYISTKLELRENPIRDQVNKAWADIFRRLMIAGLTRPDDEDRLLRSHWLMAYDAEPKKWDGSKSIKEHFKLKSFVGEHTRLLADITDYTKVLKDCLTPFCDAYQPISADSFTVFPEQARPNLRRYQEKLRRIGVIAPFLPLLIACRLRFPSDSQKYIDLVKLCELFAFRVYRVAGKRSNAGQPRLFKLGRRLYSGEVQFEEAMLKLRSYALRYCPNHNFLAFAELDEHQSDWYGWSGLKYLLYEYEEYLAGNRELYLTWDSVLKGDPQKTIEHILPQNPRNQYWKDRFNAVARKRLTDDIGNLCLTVDNSVYGIKSFPDKKGKAGSLKCYANSNLYIEHELAGFTDWDESAILQRRKKIIDWYLDRWHLDEAGITESVEDIEEDSEAEETA